MLERVPLRSERSVEGSVSGLLLQRDPAAEQLALSRRNWFAVDPTDAPQPQRLKKMHTNRRSLMGKGRHSLALEH